MMMLLQRVMRLQPAKQGRAAQLGWAWLYRAMPVRVLNSASISKFCPTAERHIRHREGNSQVILAS